MIRTLRFVVFLVVVCYFSYTASAALGITPALKELNFVPGAEYTFDYEVISDHDDRKISIIAEGDLAQYVTLTPEEVTGAGSFKVHLKLPANIDLPGQHTIAITLQEEPPETEFIGVAIRISGALRVFVPYPGRYAELTLSIPDINSGEQIPVELRVVNRGRTPLSLSNVSVDFKDQDTGEFIENIQFTPADIEISADRYFRKYLDTNSFLPGNYLAVASVVAPPDEWSVNSSFRVGSLFVNVTNYSQILYNKDIQKFYVTLQSRWNGLLSPVYVDVNLTSPEKTLSFRTPSVDLNPWSTYNAESYVDTSELPLGQYGAVFTVFYPGANSTAYGTVSVEEYRSPYIIYIAVGIGILVLVILIYWYIVHRRRKNHEKN